LQRLHIFLQYQKGIGAYSCATLNLITVFMSNLALSVRIFCLALAPAALFAQTVPPNGATTRDITSELSTELQRDCKRIDQTVSPARVVAVSPCTTNFPARVRVGGSQVSGVIPPLLLTVPNVGGKMFVEMSSTFVALGFSVAWDNPTQTVTATRNDFVVKMTLGSHVIKRIVNGLPANDYVMEAGLNPFLATSVVPSLSNKTMIPLAAVADVTGSDVQWTQSTRTADVLKGTAYFYERQPDGTGTDIMHTEMRYLPSGAVTTCSAGQVFDMSARFCADPITQSVRNVYGNFPANYRSRAQALGMSSTQAASNTWPMANFLAVADSVGLTGRTTSDVVAEMEGNLEIFGLPFDNHDISTPGMFSVTGGNWNSFVRSEAILPPFVMSGRRQTDQMVRNLYAMLPDSVRSTTAFLMPDRVAQNPAAYLDYIRSKQNVVLIGSFKGARTITDITSTNPAPTATMLRQYQAMQTRQHRELFKLRTTLALVNSLNKPVVDMFYAMGDSKTSFALSVRANLQTRLNQMMTAAGYGNLVTNNSSKLTWGADELGAVAFAKMLPARKVYIEASNASAVHIWDALFSTDQIINEKLPTLNLQRVATPAEADFEIHILNREPGIFAKINAGQASPAGRAYSTDDLNYIADRSAWTVDINAQAAHDDAFVAKLAGFSATRRARSIIIDGRVPNGAWDKKSAPASTDWLIFSAWGTFANNFALAAAQGKVVYHARVAGAPAGVNVTANARRMYLEAVAHDVYANGYYEGQRNSLSTTHASFREKLELPVSSGGAGITFVHQQGYSAENTYGVFKLLNTHVNAGMKAHFPSLPTNTSFQVNAQFWRTFETEVHMYPVGAGEILTPGLYRVATAGIPGTAKPMTEVLSPLFRATGTDMITNVTLRSLLGLEAGVR
jgi:hypothetical protein